MLSQVHPWVTRDGLDPLLSAEENTANLVEPPTQEETDQAITSNLSNVLVLVRMLRPSQKARIDNFIIDEGGQEVSGSFDPEKTSAYE